MKSLIVIALVMAAFLMPSCKKNYTCTCTFVDSTGKSTQQIVGSMNTTKSKAQKDCDNYPNSFKFASTPTGCHL